MTTESSPRRRLVIAIDGPAGAGKSTLAAYLAGRFGLLNLETGAMYRAFALRALETATSVDDPAALATLTKSTDITLQPRPNDSNRVLMNGVDVTARIRDKNVAEAASRVSVHPQIRTWMVARQRAMGEQGGVVMEGRDIGTHVFPDADVKIFLDASDTVRGERRFSQEQATGGHNAKVSTLGDVTAAVRERDARDRSRVASPLEPAPDAVRLDTSQMSLDEVFERAESLVASKVRFLTNR